MAEKCCGHNILTMISCRGCPTVASSSRYAQVANGYQKFENNYSHNLQRSTVWHWLYTSRLTEKLLHSTQKKQQKLRIHFKL